ncbi:MAG: hypothetical protein EP334_10030 [Gammaproteobacteria bacterium]|nr:MAG: hypothetical protein EP334_10030 [Gammaproteobacteria bacterium]
MITVYSVLWGDKYPPDYVYRLQAMLERHLTVPFSFVCVTDQDLEGVHCVAPIVPWHGWWQKLSLFEIAHGPSLYFDLDTVIVGNIDYLARQSGHVLAAPANWGQSGHGGIQSSVLAWNGTLKEPFRKFNYEQDSKRLWGDQEYLSELYGDNFHKLEGVVSYKYHCRGGLPAHARVVCFHGRPDYPEVNEPWVREFAYMQAQACASR